jgi:surfeit locus 1 family protein
VRLVFPLVCTGLGTWQLYRLNWKRKLLADIDNGLQLEPIQLDSLDDCGAHQHRRLKLEGFRIDDSEEPIVVGPRSAKNVLGTEPLGSLLIRKITDRDGASYLLNDGWIPWKATAWQYRAPDMAKEQFVLDRNERVSSLSQKNRPELGEWRWKDIGQLAEAMGTRPTMVKRLPASDQDQSLAVPSPATFEIPNRHLEYVLTWYGLATATFLMSFLKR